MTFSKVERDIVGVLAKSDEYHFSYAPTFGNRIKKAVDSLAGIGVVQVSDRWTDKAGRTNAVAIKGRNFQ